MRFFKVAMRASRTIGRIGGFGKRKTGRAIVPKTISLLGFLGIDWGDGVEVGIGKVPVTGSG